MFSGNRKCEKVTVTEHPMAWIEISKLLTRGCLPGGSLSRYHRTNAGGWGTAVSGHGNLKRFLLILPKLCFPATENFKGYDFIL